MKLSVHFSLVSLLLVFIYTGLYLEFVIFVGIIILHELGHLIACLIFKQKVNRLNITLVGGFLDVEIRRISFKKELIIYLAGIIVNLILLIFSHYIKHDYYRNLIFKYNFLLIAFNLLPIYPLDGYRVLDLMLSLINDPFKSYKVSFYISWFALFGLIIYSIMIKSMAFLVIASFLTYQNIALGAMKSNIVLKKLVKQYKT